MEKSKNRKYKEPNITEKVVFKPSLPSVGDGRLEMRNSKAAE